MNEKKLLMAVLFIAALAVAMAIYRLIKKPKGKVENNVTDTTVTPPPVVEIEEEEPNKVLTDEEIGKFLELYCLVIGCAKDPSAKKLFEEIKERKWDKGFSEGGYEGVTKLIEKLEEGTATESEILKTAFELKGLLEGIGFRFYFYDDETDAGRKLNYKAGDVDSIEIPAAYRVNKAGREIHWCGGRK